MKKVQINTISAVIHEPSEPSDVLVILLPGYLDSKDYEHLVRLAEDLKNEGYTAVRFDPTGTWESDGDIAAYTMQRQLDDVKEVIAYMLSQTSYQKIILGGHSRGGLVSLLYALQDPRISAVFGLMSPYALVRTAQQDKMEQWKKDGFRISTRDIPGSMETREFRVPLSNIEDTMKYLLLDEIAKLHIPLLLIAGDQDDLVPPEEIQMIYEKANDPKTFICLKGVDHNYRMNPSDIRTVNNAVVHWIREEIKRS